MGSYVAVVGPGQPEEPSVLEAAELVGRELARRGAVVVCGGRGGAMEAVCRGAASEGGTAIGILPGDDRSEANEWVTVAIPTGLGELRNGLVVRAADAVIAVGGGFGTLSEIGLALRIGRTVIGLGTWELGRGGRPVGDAIVVARDARDAVERALAAAAAGARGP